MLLMTMVTTGLITIHTLYTTDIDIVILTSITVTTNLLIAGITLLKEHITATLVQLDMTYVQT